MYKYCLECDWHASTEEGLTRDEVSKRAIDHFVATGHTVDSVRIPPPVVQQN